jgi:hypothetical protein
MIRSDMYLARELHTSKREESTRAAGATSLSLSYE